MGKGYAGKILAIVTCPACKKETDQPEATTDGKHLFAVCNWCGCEFKVKG